MASALALASCMTLDFYPHNAISRYDVGDENIDLFYYGLYNCSQYKPGTDGYYMKDIAGGDLRRGGSSGAGMSVKDMIQQLQIPSSGFINGPWTSYYAWLYQVNCFILSGYDLSDTHSYKKKYLGTAYFFRGLIYYNLTSLWREVPIIDTPTNASVPKNSEAECWAFTEENIRLAIELLEDFDGDNTYLSKQAAQALMARTCLAQGKMEEAEQYAEAVIKSGHFALDTYANIWDGDTNKEVIFCYANTGADENGVQMANVFRGAPTYIPTTEFESLVLTNDERFPYLAFADGVNITFNKYNTYGGYDPIVVARLSEMYLISAEAKGRADGLARLNELRTKRGLAKLANIDTDDDFIDAILAERRLELATEGFRWFDLARTGRIETIGLDKKYAVMPIPETQIERSNGILTQNPLWITQ